MSKKLAIFLITLCFICSFFVGSCKSVDWAAVENSEDVDALWRFINSSPDDVRAAEARARIAAIEYREAKKQNTRYAYRMFLERHPQSTQAIEAIRRLEALEFTDAERENTREGWERFLRSHPRSEKFGIASKKLDDLLCAGLEHASTGGLEAILKSRPYVPCAAVIQSLLQTRAFEEAIRSRDTAAMLDLTARHPEHPLAMECRKLIVAYRAEEFVKYGQYDMALELVTAEASDKEVDDLTRMIQAGRLSWVLESFDPVAIRKYLSDMGLEDSHALEFATAIEKDPRRFESLRDAASTLRRPAVDVTGLDTSADPKIRWEYADLLSLLPQESSAETLLSLLGDHYIEVRRRAYRALARVLDNMGPLRKASWLSNALAKLQPTAREGVLLFRLYALETLAGDTLRAERVLERLFAAREDPDPLVSYLTVLAKRSLGKEREAAVAAKTFCEQAKEWTEKRTLGWSGEGGVGSESSAWLSLRQLHGLAATWRETLEPFLRQPAASMPDDLGPWLSRCREGLQSLDGWLLQQEELWERSHPGYTRSSAGPAYAAEQEQRMAREQAAALWLGLAGPETAVTLRWAACCHPRQETRQAAALATWFFRVRLGFPALGRP